MPTLTYHEIETYEIPHHWKYAVKSVSRIMPSRCPKCGCRYYVLDPDGKQCLNCGKIFYK